MKLTAGKRILMFIHWLLSALICAAFTAYIVRPELVLTLYNRATGKLTPTQTMVLGIAILAVYVIVAVAQLILIFKRRRRGDRGFITVDSSDNGPVRIAVSAVEQMVRQSVTTIDGIHEMKVSISNDDDAVKIDINAVIVGGSHVPTITMNMQRAIRQFVEMNCGVAVRSVSISINSVFANPDAKGRRGRNRYEAPAVPGPEALNASRPVEPAPEPAQTVAPVYEPPVEPTPIKLTLDPPNASEAVEGDEEAPQSAGDETS